MYTILRIRFVALDIFDVFPSLLDRTCVYGFWVLHDNEMKRTRWSGTIRCRKRKWENSCLERRAQFSARGWRKQERNAAPPCQLKLLKLFARIRHLEISNQPFSIMNSVGGTHFNREKDREEGRKKERVRISFFNASRDVDRCVRN